MFLTSYVQERTSPTLFLKVSAAQRDKELLNSQSPMPMFGLCWEGCQCPFLVHFCSCPFWSDLIGEQLQRKCDVTFPIIPWHFFFLNVSTIHSAYRTIQWWTRCSASGRMNRWWHCSGRLQHIGMGRTPSASSPAKSHTACHWASGIWLDRILVLSPKFL